MFIVAYREDTSRLERCLREEGFEVSVNRRANSAEEMTYPAQSRCLLNHVEIWQKIVAAGEPAVVVEADFVPVAGFGELPCPIPSGESRSICWLYFGGGRLRHVDDAGFAQGTAPTTVAMVVLPDACGMLVRFAQSESADGKLARYTPWDTRLAVFVRAEGGKVFLPFKSYGEHGGVGNREHEAHGVRTNHRADVLWGSLPFLPDYAGNSRWRYYATRCFYRARGTVKFFACKYIPFEQVLGKADYPASLILRMVAFSLRRFFT